MRIIKLLLAVAILTPVLSNALDVGEDVYIIGTNTATFMQQDEDRERWMWDDLTTEFTIRNATIGIKTELYQPKRMKFGSPPDSVEHNAITRRYLRYQDRDITFYVGHYEKTIGRGLAFRSYYNESLDEDNIVDGIMASSNFHDIADVTGLFGTWKEESNEDPHKVRAASLDIYPFKFIGALPDRMLTISGEIVSAELIDPKGGPRDTQVLGGGGYFTWDYFDVYGEYILKTGYDPSNKEEDYDGSGLYVATNIYVPYITIGAQYKDYDHIATPFSDPPPATVSTRSINDGENESGYVVSAGSRPIDDIFVEGGYASSESDPIVVGSSSSIVYLMEYFGKAQYEIPFDSLDMSLEVGYNYWDEYTERTEATNNVIKTGELRKWPTGKLTYAFLDDHSILLEGDYESRTRHLMETTYTDRRADFGYTFRSITGFTVQYEDTNEAVQERYGMGLTDVRDINQWLWGEAFVNLAPGRTFSVGYGSRRGGVICSGGVCQQEAPFSGFRIDFSGSF